jgi:lipoprotein-releasing system ATP-binding protein
MSEIVRLEAVRKKYTTKAGELEVLQGIDLVINEGDFITILGHSGAGKSTLLHIIGLLDRPSSGRISFKGSDVSRMSQGRLDRLRNAGFGFVFQFYHLLPEFDALENALMPQMVRHGFFGWLLRGGGIRTRCAELLGTFGLSERLTHRPSELSGGEQQRVAIARALAGEPEVLLADEPTGNLDEKTGKEIFDMLIELNRTKGQTLVVVTHETELAMRCPNALVLEDGRLHRFDAKRPEGASK